LPFSSTSASGAVGEDHHQVAGGVEIVERVEQTDGLLDRACDHRALIGNAMNSFQSPINAVLSRMFS
jgi:hypothetical protein